MRERYRGAPSPSDGIALGRARVESLDVLRGLTIALMILVNNPGDWAHTFWPLLHAHWNGLTLADLVFPSFLFIMGCAIPFALGRRLEKGERRWRLWREIAQRSVALVLLGIGLNALGHGGFQDLRVYGVLQHLGVCYAFGAGLYLAGLRLRGLSVAAVLLVLVYYLLLLAFPEAAAGGPAFMNPHGNLAARLDRLAMGALHDLTGMGVLYEGDRDPEGLLTLVPSGATLLLGILSGIIIRQDQREHPRRILGFLRLTGGGLLVTGLVWSLIFPLNKNLWTSSYVLVCGGLDMLALSWLYDWVDVRQTQRGNTALRGMVRVGVVFGANPIVAYLFSEILAIVLGWHWSAAATLPAGSSLYENLFGPAPASDGASLIYAVAYVAVCFIPSYWLWHRKIVIRL